MCGIIAYIGENLPQKLIEGLEKLEYRGYDSAGMTICENGEFITKKSVGNVKELKKMVENDNFSGLGIAHTRWATHGKISLENAHPHLSERENLALVHNGIIENYGEIKERIKDKKFYGETDSEVVAKFFGEDIDGTLFEKLQEIKGSYAFAILCRGQSKIYFAKNKSPLYIFEGKMIASDPSCFVGYGREYISLEDGDYGYIDGAKRVIFNNKKEVFRKPKLLDFDFCQLQNKKFQHFMLKEIYDSKLVLEGIISRYSLENSQKLVKKLNISHFNRIYFIACGTAYHAGLMAGEYFRKHFDKEIYVEKGGEFCYKNLHIDSKSLCFFISQSGETADTLLAMEWARDRGGRCVACVNTIYSTLAQKCEFVFPICAGQERAVASTKAYFGQVLTLMAIANILKGEDFIPSFKMFLEELDFGDDDEILKVANYLKEREKLFFIGRGLDYISAQEASLKMKEISYIFSCGESSAELKHGSLALIEEGVDGVLIATDKDTLSKNISTAREIQSRGGRVIFVSPLETEAKFDFKIKVSPCQQEFAPLQAMIVLQKLAYFTSILRGNNPDKPRNLAKSVTVE